MPLIINQYTECKTLKHDELLELLVQSGAKVGVTAEQCGALLYDACSISSPNWFSDAFRDAERVKRAAARRRIRELLGAERAERLMKLESKLYR